MDTKGGKWWWGGGGGTNWEIGIDMYTLICIKWITNKNLLYKKINKIELRDFRNNKYLTIINTETVTRANKGRKATEHSCALIKSVGGKKPQKGIKEQS